MKISLPVTSLVSVLLLNACAHDNILLTGTVNEKKESNQIQIYLNSEPDCDFEIVAMIQIPGGYYSRGSLLSAFRNSAAHLGADALQVTYLQKVGASEFYGSARALRCLDS
jgi:hypothetical protein